MMAILAPICSNTSHNLPQFTLNPSHTDAHPSLSEVTDKVEMCVAVIVLPTDISEIESQKQQKPCPNVQTIFRACNFLPIKVATKKSI